MPALDVALACRGPGGSKLDPGALTSLDLRGKGVNAVAPSLGSYLTSLAKLDLADNVLGNDCVKELASLRTLKHLSLANNSLREDALRPWLRASSTDADADAAARSGKKQKRADERAPKTHARRGKHSVNRNGVGVAGVSGSYPVSNDGTLPLLRVLNVSGNGLVSVSGVAAARNLGALIANENNIQTLQHVEPLTNLNTLVASSNAIDEIGDEFRNLVNLNKLSLSHNGLESIGDALTGCVALRELRLAHNKIQSLPKRALAGCRDLRVLDVSGNAFRDFGDVEALKSLPRLQQLSMRGSPLSRNAKSYDATIAKMCPALKTLDGRRVGPGGWLDSNIRDGDRRREGDTARDSKVRASDAWVDARAAAGLDPLEAVERAEPSDDDASESGSASADDDDDAGSEEEEMDDEEREMVAEVNALRASMRAEERARRARDEAAKRGGVDGSDGERDGDEKPRRTKTTETKTTETKTTSDRAPTPRETAEGGASFLRELVARNVGTVRGGFGGGGEDARRKTDDEKSAAATRSGVVKIVEVKRKKGGEGDETRRKKVVATGRDALLALLGDSGPEATDGGDGAWGGGGWDLEGFGNDATEAMSPGTARRQTETKPRAADEPDVATRRSEKKKKKKRVSDDFDDSETHVRVDASAKKRAREDDPWNDDEARRRKRAMLAKKKARNVLARRYKK